MYKNEQNTVKLKDAVGERYRQIIKKYRWIDDTDRQREE